MCGIVGSPRKNGNVDILVSQVLKGARSKGATTHKIYLNNLNIRPCQSCGADPYPKHCLLDDDMNEIYGMLEACDAIVLGSPVYFDTVSAQTKLMIDRSNCLTPYVRQPDGTMDFEKRIKKRKKGIFIAVAGTEQEWETIMRPIKGFFNWANIELVDKLFYAHDDNELGGVKDNKETVTKALEIGVQLAKKDGEGPT